MEVARQTLAGKTVAEEVSSFLEDIKDAFLDGRAISIILEIMRTIIKEVILLKDAICIHFFGNNRSICHVLIFQEQKDNFKHIEKRETLNNCLLLMHNILHIPEILSEKPAITIKNCCSKQNQIIWY